MSPGELMSSGSAAGSTGLPLWVICAVVFVSILGIALLLMLGPGHKTRVRTRQARLSELRRYRLIGVSGSDQVTATDADAAVESSLGARALVLVDRAVRARGKRAALVSELERSGMRMRPEEWAAIQLSAIVATAAFAVFLGGSILGIVVGAPVAWLACRLFMRFKIKRRAAAFESALPDALQLVAGALRSGFALNQSIGAVAREGGEPVAGEFSRVLQEVRLGADLEDALDDLAERMTSYDMRLVVMAIRTAREIGGNLAEVLSTTVVTMRERVQLRSQVLVLSAEGRLSAKILTGLPILMGCYLLVFKKDYLRPMYTTGPGIAMLVTGGALLTIGSFWLSRLTKIEV